VEVPSKWQAEKIEDDILREMVEESKSKGFCKEYAISNRSTNRISRGYWTSMHSRRIRTGMQDPQSIRHELQLQEVRKGTKHWIPSTKLKGFYCYSYN